MTTSPSTPLRQNQIKTTGVSDGNSDAYTTTTLAPWSSETNWTVSRGSLDTALTFESFDFPIDSESTAPKPPLLLVPPSSSDFEPCEIKINFTQKHEIRQVYVRSTARVYEIYYAPGLDSENEYLCTVRCSAASVDENVFLATDKETVSLNLEGPNEILLKEKAAGENNKIGTSEDDWVEIKLPRGRPSEGNGYLPNQTSSNIRNYQDYYEATAEINDSEPCMSVTLRLLSLQTKGHVYVNEVYVFADSIETNGPDNPTVNPENSSGSTLMTMLVPTLLGLAKSSPSPLHSQNNSKSLKNPEPFRTTPEPATSSFSVKLAESAPTAPVNIAESALVPAPSCNHVERILEQLVSRVSRIEEICSRFEENMLKPINSIEARLEHVEQQVELLSKNTKNDSQLCGEESESEMESKKKNFCDEKTEVNDVEMAKMDDTLVAALARFSSFATIDKTLEASDCTQGNEYSNVETGCDDKVVSLVYENLKTVSEKSSEICVFEGANDEEAESRVDFEPSILGSGFSCEDENTEVNDVVELPKMEKQKKHVSIDDALAAALAGFSSCTTIDATLEASSSSEFLKEMAPECTQASESMKAETDSEDEVVSLVYENRKPVVVSPKLSENGGSEFAFDEKPVAPTRVTTGVNSQDGVESSENGNTFLVTHVGPVYENTKTVVVSPKSSENGVSTCAFDEQLVGVSVTQSMNNLEPTKNGKTLLATHVGPVSENAKAVVVFPNSSENGVSKRVFDEEASMVDLEASILEVKFASLNNDNMMSPLEALLSYTGDNGVVINQETDMRVFEENKTNRNGLLVEFDGDYVATDLALVHEETTFASLI